MERQRQQINKSGAPGKTLRHYLLKFHLYAAGQDIHTWSILFIDNALQVTEQLRRILYLIKNTGCFMERQKTHRVIAETPALIVILQTHIIIFRIQMPGKRGFPRLPGTTDCHHRVRAHQLLQMPRNVSLYVLFPFHEQHLIIQRVKFQVLLEILHKHPQCAHNKGIAHGLNHANR